MLTDVESKWIAKLQKVLNGCPSRRLGFYTIGDSSIVIYDKSKDDAIEATATESGFFCNAVDEHDAKLAEVTFPSNVHATAG